MSPPPMHPGIVRCQRNSLCPMCWEAISMKDPTRIFLDALVQESNVQENWVRTSSIFCHPLLSGFEVPVGADDGELEERIMQHLTAADAVRRPNSRADAARFIEQNGTLGDMWKTVLGNNLMLMYLLDPV